MNIRARQEGCADRKLDASLKFDPLGRFEHAPPNSLLTHQRTTLNDGRTIECRGRWGLSVVGGEHVSGGIWVLRDFLRNAPLILDRYGE